MNVFQRWMKGKPAEASSEPLGSVEMEDDAPSGLAELLARLEALAESGKAHDALNDYAARHHGDALQAMSTGMDKISYGMRALAVQSAHGAAHLDPNALGRILDRMDSLGDATLRQIEGRIGVTASREGRRQLQMLRDEMRRWLDARDLHLQEAQLAVDELNDGASALREELLKRAGRLIKAADIAAAAARQPPSEALRHAAPEAGFFAASLRRLLESMRF